MSFQIRKNTETDPGVEVPYRSDPSDPSSPVLARPRVRRVPFNVREGISRRFGLNKVNRKFHDTVKATGASVELAVLGCSGWHPDDSITLADQEAAQELGKITGRTFQVGEVVKLESVWPNEDARRWVLSILVEGSGVVAHIVNECGRVSDRAEEAEGKDEDA